MNNVTKHAEKRVRKRLGKSKSTVVENFGTALLSGRKHGEFKGAFKKYLDYYAMFYHSTPIIHQGVIYWVVGSKLITAWQVPQKYRKYL